MMKLKKILALMLALVLLLSLCACGSFEGKLVTAAKRMSDLESLHADMGMEMVLSMALLGESMDMDLNVDASIDMQLEPMRMKMLMDINAMGVSQQLISYAEAEGERYAVYSSSDDGSSWEKNYVDDVAEAGQPDIAANMELFLECAESFEEVGEEQIQGSAATRYDGEFTGDQIVRAMEVSGAQEMLEDSVSTDAGMSELLAGGSIPASIWIDNKSGMIVRYEMDLIQIMQGVFASILEEQMSGLDTQGLTLDVELTQCLFTMELSQFEAIEEIVIPSQAQAA